MAPIVRRVVRGDGFSQNRPDRLAAPSPLPATRRNGDVVSRAPCADDAGAELAPEAP